MDYENYHNMVKGEKNALLWSGIIAGIMYTGMFLLWLWW